MLLMTILTQSSSFLASELPLLILFPLPDSEVGVIPVSEVCELSRSMTFWTMLCPNDLGTQLVFYHMCLILLPGSNVGLGFTVPLSSKSQGCGSS